MITRPPPTPARRLQLTHQRCSDQDITSGRLCAAGSRPIGSQIPYPVNVSISAGAWAPLYSRGRSFRAKDTCHGTNRRRDDGWERHRFFHGGNAPSRLGEAARAVKSRGKGTPRSTPVSTSGRQEQRGPGPDHRRSSSHRSLEDAVGPEVNAATPKGTTPRARGAGGAQLPPEVALQPETKSDQARR